MANKLRIKPSIYILEETPAVYQVIFTGTRLIKRFGVDDLVKEVIAKVPQSKSEEHLLTSLKQRFGNLEVISCINSLESQGILERFDTSYSNDRFSKQVSFLSELTGSWEDAIKIQKDLQKKKVAVFGVGGIGTWMVNGLYQIGIGELRIVDKDVVQLSNLNRQLYFNAHDLGKSKVDVVKQKIPDANIIAYKRWVSENENLEDITNGCDFLVNCTDNPSVADTTRIISKYARQQNIPYLASGGYNLHLGMVGPIIVPGKNACFDCFLANQKENDKLSKLKKIHDIEQTGNLGPIAGTIANLQVMDIFKYFTHTGSYNSNRFAEINFLDFSVEWRQYKQRDGCDCVV